MTATLLAHVVAGLAAPWVVRALGLRWGFLVLALVPALTAGWVGFQWWHGLPLTEEFAGVEQLHLSLAFRLDALSALLLLLVCGVGALVLAYCADYFHERDGTGVRAFAAYLVGFAAAMVGLVTTDDLLVLFVFWELTTILSYLLIGYHDRIEGSRVAARQALIVTTAGGLAMLVGVVILGEQAGTYRISEIVADPPSAGPTVTAGIVLLLVGAISKSALVPFHFWLPSAMAAPTPVSAYLHAAAMVKAGVYLVARFAPAFAEVPVWQVMILLLGSITMLVGGWRALRQYDLKLLLAYGTVSQLGMLILLLGWGNEGVALAGVTLVLAHGLFKSALFLTVGAIERATGTRDLRMLSGVARQAPWFAGAAVIAGLSMAGLPPMLGFVGKEAALTGMLEAEWSASTMSSWALVAFVLGSTLTVAYTARFLMGAFGPAWEDNSTQPGTASPGVTSPEQTAWQNPGLLLLAVPMLLGALGFVLGPVSRMIEPGLAAYATTMPSMAEPVTLGLWHGLTPALGLSVLIWVLGGLLVLARVFFAHLQARVAVTPEAGAIYQRVVRGIDRAALEGTGATARGSLPVLLGTVFVLLAVLPGVQLLRGVTWPDSWLWWDSPAQVAIALIVMIAAIATTRARRRLRAVFLVGVTGYGIALLFLLHGAPDLALTQVLVETVAIVVFVLVLRRMSGKFPDDPSPLTRKTRAFLGAAVGVVLVGATATAAAVRNWPPAGEGLAQSAVDFGGGDNVVNVILVDARAWDTMGELSVVLAAATGVASLIFLREDVVDRVRRQLKDTRRVRGALVPDPTGERRWLAAAADLDPRRRSTIFEVVTRVVFHTIILWSLYLLFSGHNAPGGGFAAGLVCGLALTVRYLAGRGHELRMAAPVMPGLLLGAGLFVAAGSAFLPMILGYAPLQTYIADVHVPVLGEVHVVTSLLFDVGVYLVIVGLMLDLLRSLGSALDDQIAQEQDEATVSSPVGPHEEVRQ